MTSCKYKDRLSYSYSSSTWIHSLSIVLQGHFTFGGEEEWGGKDIPTCINFLTTEKQTT